MLATSFSRSIRRAVPDRTRPGPGQVATVRADSPILRPIQNGWASLSSLRSRTESSRKTTSSASLRWRVPLRLTARSTLPSRRNPPRACRSNWSSATQGPALTSCSASPNPPIEQFPAYMLASAALDQAQRDLDLTCSARRLTAWRRRWINPARPFRDRRHAGVRRDRRQRPWVDANPKETDITHLQIGQRAHGVCRHVPGHKFLRHRRTGSPGTGAQFAILPPQNASGNWVKVVQRVPVRVRLDRIR